MIATKMIKNMYVIGVRFRVEKSQSNSYLAQVHASSKSLLFIVVYYSSTCNE